LQARLRRAASGEVPAWIRYVDHRKKTEPFKIAVKQSGKVGLTSELGVIPVVSA
jgi:hypothetical protein